MNINPRDILGWCQTFVKSYTKSNESENLNIDQSSLSEDEDEYQTASSGDSSLDEESLVHCEKDLQSLSNFDNGFFESCYDDEKHFYLANLLESLFRRIVRHPPLIEDVLPTLDKLIQRLTKLIYNKNLKIHSQEKKIKYLFKFYPLISVAQESLMKIGESYKKESDFKKICNKFVDLRNNYDIILYMENLLIILSPLLDMTKEERTLFLSKQSHYNIVMKHLKRSKNKKLNLLKNQWKLTDVELSRFIKKLKDDNFQLNDWQIEIINNQEEFLNKAYKFLIAEFSSEGSVLYKQRDKFIHYMEEFNQCLLSNKSDRVKTILGSMSQPWRQYFSEMTYRRMTPCLKSLFCKGRDMEKVTLDKEMAQLNKTIVAIENEKTRENTNRIDLEQKLHKLTIQREKLDKQLIDINRNNMLCKKQIVILLSEFMDKLRLIKLDLINKFSFDLAMVMQGLNRYCKRLLDSIEKDFNTDDDPFDLLLIITTKYNKYMDFFNNFNFQAQENVNENIQSRKNFCDYLGTLLPDKAFNENCFFLVFAKWCENNKERQLNLNDGDQTMLLRVYKNIPFTKPIKPLLNQPPPSIRHSVPNKKEVKFNLNFVPCDKDTTKDLVSWLNSCLTMIELEQKEHLNDLDPWVMLLRQLSKENQSRLLQAFMASIDIRSTELYKKVISMENSSVGQDMQLKYDIESFKYRCTIAWSLFTSYSTELKEEKLQIACKTLVLYLEKAREFCNIFDQIRFGLCKNDF